MADLLTWSIAQKNLKGMGYEFKKLYAANYIVYYKKIKEYDIWLWKLDRTIEIKDWHQNTINVLRFFKNNIDHPEFDKPGFRTPIRDYIKVQLNIKTGIVQMFDFEEYSKVFNHKDINHAWDDWIKKYGSGWSNEIYLHRTALKLVLKEIELLGGKI